MESHCMSSEVESALRILGLKSSAIKTLNLFGERVRAEKAYFESAQNINNASDLESGLQDANYYLKVLQAWDTLCDERLKYSICPDCSRLTKIAHQHCPECSCLLQIKITWPEEDVGVERKICQKCEYTKTRVIDDPNEVAKYQPEDTKEDDE